MRSSPVIEILEKYKGRIIDVHAHVGPDQRFLMKGTVGEIIEAYDRYGIKLGYVSSTLSLLGGCMEGNKHILRVVRLFPDRFRGLFSLNPLYGEEIVPLLEKYVREYGFRGVKFHPQYFHLEPSEKISTNFLERLVKIKIPLMLHSYDGGVEVEKLAERFPDLTIIAYHMGGIKWRECLRRVKRYTNVYVEISSSVTVRGFIEEAVEVLGSNRIMFGTDVPYLDPSVSLGKVLGADISEEDVENILFRNAERVLEV